MRRARRMNCAAEIAMHDFDGLRNASAGGWAYSGGGRQPGSGRPRRCEGRRLRRHQHDSAARARAPRPASSQCVNGAEARHCAAGTPNGSDNDCDGIDQDCDGRTDEAYTPLAEQCGIGVCATRRRCAARYVSQRDCTPGSAPATTARAMGSTKTATPSIDEAYVPVVTDCGVGARQRRGTSLRQHGARHGCARAHPRRATRPATASTTTATATRDEATCPLAATAARRVRARGRDELRGRRGARAARLRAPAGGQRRDSATASTTTATA